MFVCCECCALSGRGLCDELITGPKEPCRLWCVVVCDLENLKIEEAMGRVGTQRHSKKKNPCVISSRDFYSLPRCLFNDGFSNSVYTAPSVTISKKKLRKN